ncbi:MAG: hypothetical protein V4541_08925 [Bacteroidota bacterium]
MSCNHKFINDLNLENLDFEPKVLLVGTFNPAWPESNLAQWFYGRTQYNYFWDVLPRLYGEQSMLDSGPDEWKKFCKRYKIAITDLIGCIGDAVRPEHDKVMKSYSDEKIAQDFQEHTFVDIVSLLKIHPTIKNVYFTRGAAPTFWSRLWRPVRYYCEINKIQEDTLLTPSGYAFYQHGRYNNTNPHQPISNLANFILMSWQQKWHQVDM